MDFGKNPSGNPGLLLLRLFAQAHVKYVVHNYEKSDQVRHHKSELAPTLCLTLATTTSKPQRRECHVAQVPAFVATAPVGESRHRREL